MKVALVGIYDRGDLAKERVHFRALADIDLRFYAIFDTQRIDVNRIFVGNRSCLWFISQPVKSGDNIVIYTRAGNPNVEKHPNGAIFHFIFRGLNQPLYTNKDSCAVIFEINNWVTVS